MSLSDYIARWRHSRGYGVHSPLAFRIVKDCVRPDGRYGFYSDSYLDFEFRTDNRRRLDARMLIRLINMLHPNRMWIPACDKRIKEAIAISFPKLHVATQRECPKGTDMIVDFQGNDLERLWNRFGGIEECNLIAFTSKKTVDTSGFENAPTLIMEGRRFKLLLRRIGMSPTSYLLP